MFFAEQILFFLGVFVTTGLLLTWRKKKAISPYNYPPSLPSLPLVGSLPFIRDVKDIYSLCSFLLKKSAERGPIFTLRVGNRLVLTLNSKDSIEKAYVRNSSAFNDRPKVFSEELANPKAKGVVFARTASDWKKPQQLSLAILKEFGFGTKSTMETRILHEVEAMTDFIKQKKGEAFDPNEVCTLATSNVILNMISGRRRDYELGLSNISIETNRLLSNHSFIYDIVPLIRFLPSHRETLKRLVATSKTLFKTIETEIARSLQDTTQSCFVKSYIQKEGPDYDRDQLNYILRDLVTAGTDTSSTTFQWALVALANNLDVQKRLHAEIDDVLPGDQLPSLQDQTRLPYVEATILEITRWRAIIPLSIPRITAQDTVTDGYFVPNGTMVFANLHAAHFDTNVWKDPEVFRPERFLDGDNNIIGKENVIPFSIGRRSCLGENLARAEMFLIFTSLVKRFLVLPPEGQDRVNEEPRVPASSILFPAPFKVRLIERA